MNHIDNKKYVLAAIVLIIVFTAGFYFGKYNNEASINDTGTKIKYNLTNRETVKDVDFRLFWEAWDKIEENYVDKKELNIEAMVWGAINGMVNSLGDPHTSFLNRKDNKKFTDDISGSFEGIGAEIGIRNGQLKIIAPLEGTPAKQAGLRAGDAILQIGERSSADITLDEAVNLIRGPKNSTVSLLILRDEWDEPKEMKVVRDTIQIPVLDYELLDNNIAHLKIYSFTDSLSATYSQIAQQILKDGAKGIIIDLRNNPGGLLDTAVEITSYHLEKDELILVEKFSNGSEQTYRSKGYNTLGNIPTVVLINQGSASASEIMAGSLRDDRNIKLVGEKTYGKGSVQQLYDLSDESSIKITVARWLTPKEVSIDELGINPDTVVELTEDDFNENRDPQLTKAIEILLNQL